MTQPTLSDFHMTVAERRSALWVRFEQHLQGQLDHLRRENDTADKIEPTTLRRGEIACVKRILALSDEVGPESSGSEARSPEFRPAGVVAGIELEN